MLSRKTHEIAEKYKETINAIPEMTNPLGKYWRQPDKEDMIINRRYAIIKQEILEALSNYSCSIPSGVYGGKLWKMKKGNKWYLCWYSRVYKGQCRINTREVLIKK